MTEDPDAFNAFEAAGWDRQSAGYDEFFGPITGRVVAPLLDAAGVDAGSRVLDVASGPGYVAVHAAARGATVIGVDVAEAMIALARRLHPELVFRRGDAEALAFDDAAFDAVVANFLLLHLGRPERALGELARGVRERRAARAARVGEARLGSQAVVAIIRGCSSASPTPTSATPPCGCAPTCR